MVLKGEIYPSASYLLLLLVLATAVFCNVPRVEAYSGQGSGSTNDPYLIANCVQLQEMQDDLTTHYKLSVDIDCSDTINWNGLKGFHPVGDGGAPFTGALDGNGKAILDLTIIRADDTPGQGVADESFVGLFGYTNAATLTDIELGRAMVKGLDYVGGIVGYMQGGTLTRSDVNRDVADNNCNPGHCIWARYGTYGGGLVGLQDGGSISNCSTSGPVKGSGNVIGGLVGSMGNYANLSSSSALGNIDGGNNIGGAVGFASGQSSINLVHATGNVDANTSDDFKQGQYAGGLVGYLSNATIVRSYATGSVHTEKFNAGGLVGETMSGQIYDSYATGNVVSDITYAGGLVGTIYDKADIQRSYAAGNVTATGSTAGGLVAEAIVTGGSDKIIIKNSFATGEIDSGASSGAFIGNLGAGVELDHNYFDITRAGTTYTSCTGNGGLVANCTGVNNNNEDASYFFNNSTAPPLDQWSFDFTWNTQSSNYPTLDDGVDSDGDGSINKVENAGPNNGDANGDSTLDSEQANVHSFVNPYGNVRQVLETDCDIISVIVIEDPGYQSDTGYVYPYGLLAFSVQCGTPGATANISLYNYSDDHDAGRVIRKKINGHFSALNHSHAQVTIGGQVVSKFTYSVKEGGEHDEDGIEDGVINDPVGIAYSTVVADTNSDTVTNTTASTGALAKTGNNIVIFYLLASVLIGLPTTYFIRRYSTQ